MWPSSTSPTSCSGPSRRDRIAPAGAAGRSTTWPSGSWRSGCPTARGVGARSSTCRARRPAATGWSAGSARPGSPRPRSWVIPPPTSCTACTRSSPTSSTSSDDVRAVRPADARYGHVVVDEAQDLSPMQWRAVARRCPTQSCTLAGDEAQAVRAGAAATWDRILESFGVAAGSVTRHELTVNYRTPAEVMELAARLLEQFAPHLHPARSVRTAGVGPRRLHTGGRPLDASRHRGRGRRNPDRASGPGWSRSSHPSSSPPTARTALSTSPPSTRRDWSSTVSWSSIPRPSSASRRGRQAWRASTSRSPGRRRGSRSSHRRRRARRSRTCSVRSSRRPFVEPGGP